MTYIFGHTKLLSRVSVQELDPDSLLRWNYRGSPLNRIELALQGYCLETPK